MILRHLTLWLVSFALTEAVVTPLPPEGRFTPAQKIRQWESLRPDLRVGGVHKIGPNGLYVCYLTEYHPDHRTRTDAAGWAWRGAAGTEEGAVEVALRATKGPPVPVTHTTWKIPEPLP
jgi:hypothetical protein